MYLKIELSSLRRVICSSLVSTFALKMQFCTLTIWKALKYLHFKAILSLQIMPKYKNPEHTESCFQKKASQCPAITFIFQIF